MNKKKESSISWAFSQAGEKKFQLILSVIVAVLGVICQVIPFLIAGQMMNLLVSGVKDRNTYFSLFLYIALGFVGKAVFHAISTSLSHGATFEILSNIRKKGLDHLAKMPLGDVLSRPAGELKNILVEQVDSIETTLAHIIPEFTSNLLAPIGILILLFMTDWRMGLASLATIPVGMLCLIGMMKDYDKSYGRTVEATKNLNDVHWNILVEFRLLKLSARLEAAMRDLLLLQTKMRTAVSIG